MNEFCTNQAQRITAVEESTKSAHLRLNKVEETTNILHEMNRNIGIMAEQNKTQNTEIKSIKKDIKEVNQKVDRLENRPFVENSNNFNRIKWLIISTVIGGIVGYFINQIL